MDVQGRLAKNTRLMKIGGVLTALSMLVMLCTLCIEFIALHNPIWGFLILTFIAGAACSASLMNAFVVTRFIKASALSSIKTPPDK